MCCVQSLSLLFLLYGITLILLISVGVLFLLSVSLPYTRDCSAPCHLAARQLTLDLSTLAVLNQLVTLSTVMLSWLILLRYHWYHHAAVLLSLLKLSVVIILFLVLVLLDI